MNIATLRQAILQESTARIEIGTVVSADVRGTTTCVVRLSGGSVCTRTYNCVEGLEPGDEVIVAHLEGKSRLVVMARIMTAYGSLYDRRSILSPPDNLATRPIPGAIWTEWDAYPGTTTLCWQIQHHDSDSDDANATDAIVTMGSYFLYRVVDADTDLGTPVTRYFRVRAIRWISDNNVMYSSWSAWVSGTSVTWDGRYYQESELSSASCDEGASLIWICDADDNFPSTVSTVELALDYIWDNGGGAGAHNIFSATHTDTVAAAAARGYVMRGNATPAWERHDASGNHLILVGDGNDITSKAFDWDDLSAGAGADMVHDHSSAAEGSELLAAFIWITDSEGNFPSTISTVELALDYIWDDNIAANIGIEEIGAATYDDVQDWIDTTQSAGKISGGALTDEGDDEITIAAGTGFVKTGTALSSTKSFDWAEENNFAIPSDGNVYYLFVKYNGGAPVIDKTTTRSDISFTDEVGLGRVYNDGAAIHVLTGGVQLQDATYRTHKRLSSVDGFVRASGMAVSESGVRGLAMTGGKWWSGITEFSAAADAAMSWTTWYSDGGAGWSSTAAQATVELKYDDGSGVTQALDSNRYGVHFVYRDYGGSFHLVYGTTNAVKLSIAQDVGIPSSTPDIVGLFSVLLAKIIVREGIANFISIESPWTTVFSIDTVTDHNDLASLQGGTAAEYYHFTSAQHTVLTGATSGAALRGTGAALELTLTPLWEGDHTYAANINMDDGAGDSPKVQFVGGSNDDTIEIYLDDDGVANHSNLNLVLCDAGGSSAFEIYDSTPTVVLSFKSDGNLAIEGNLELTDDAFVGRSTGCRFLFDWTPNPDTITVKSATLLIEDGGKIGQAAGPLLTFDDSNDLLEVTGCKVVIGTTTTAYPLRVYGASTEVMFESSGSGEQTGFRLKDAAQDWAFRKNTVGDFVIRDITGAVNPFLIKMDAPTNSFIILASGYVGLNVATPLGRLHIDQATNDAAIPTLILDQADVSEGFINFIGSDRGAIAGTTNSVSSVRAEINGTVYRLALYADA